MEAASEKEFSQASTFAGNSVNKLVPKTEASVQHPLPACSFFDYRSRKGKGLITKKFPGIAAVSHFLNRHYNPKKSVLLALSGGPDSLALLHLLLGYQKDRPLKFAIAHVDHGWRPESIVESEQLQELAKELQIPFHLKTLDPQLLSGSLEDASRKERLHFFRDLCRKYDYQAVLLGHHADDQAETVLKRVLEGSTLEHLAGIEEISFVEDVTLWRPLLNISKKSLQIYLQNHNQTGFDDYTNRDPRFLRGRFRTEIIPELAKSFGKEISSSLCHLSQEAKELKVYCQHMLGPYLDRLEVGPFGTLLDLSSDYPQDRFAVKFLLRELCRSQDFCLSRQLADTACELVLSNQGNRRLVMGQHEVVIDRRRIFILDRKMEALPAEPFALELGTHNYGPWNVSVTLSGANKPQLLGWKNAWRGRIEVVLPKAQYVIGLPRMNAPYVGGSAISRLWTNDKVPAFLRHLVPVLWQQDRISHEFLTSRTAPTTYSEELIHLNLFL